MEQLADTGELDGLNAAELERHATDAALTGHHDELVRILQRAFLAFHDEGDARGAARCAVHLSMNTADHGQHALAAGWATRAADLVAEIGEDCVEVGWVAFLRMFRAIDEGDFPRAQVLSEEANATGRRLHDTDLIAMSSCAQGRIALYSGRFAEGLAHLDEAMVRVIAGEASPFISGHVFCTAIEGC